MTTTTRHRAIGCVVAGLIIGAIARFAGMDLASAAAFASGFAGACAMISAPDAPTA